MGVEIEKKYLVKALPEDVERFPYHRITQGYLCRHPAVRVRKEAIGGGASEAAEDGAETVRFYMTYKGIRQQGVLSQEEYNLPLSPEAYAHLLAKADGTVIEKKRVILPLQEGAFDDAAVAADGKLKEWLVTEGDEAPKIELDLFAGAYEGLMIAEVEFPSEEIAAKYHPAAWFGEEVTGDERYSNAYLAFHG